MTVNKYIKFNGQNTDEVRKFLTNGTLNIEQIREGDATLKIPHWFDFKLVFSYLGSQRELNLHPNDYILEFKDVSQHCYYTVMPEKTFENNRKLLHI